MIHLAFSWCNINNFPKTKKYVVGRRDTYNRYLDYLHYKASEVISLQAEAESLVREDESHKKAIEIAKNAIVEGASDHFIAKITGLGLEHIQGLRAEMNK